MPMSAYRCGARPMTDTQASAATGPMSRKGPTPTTGGPSQLPRGARRQENRATGQNKLKIMHWNADGVNSKDGRKKMELENTLNEEQVAICCLQETHLNKDIDFNIRGSQCFRQDRKDRKKGGILTL